MDENLRQTVLNSGQQGAPASSFPELQKYYDINFQLPLSTAGVRALTGQADAKEKQREFDVKQQMEKASGKGYTRVPKEDGGYGFFDSEGNEISAYEYARATGKSALDVLSDSENPIDIGFREDYQNLQEFLQAAVNKDTQALEEFYSLQPSLRNMAPADVLKRFKAAYPTVYGGNKPGVPVGQTNIPSLASLRNRPDYFPENYTGIGGGVGG